MLLSSPGDFVGGGESAAKLGEFVRATARSSAPVLLLGEAGTGKELAARAIHFASARKNTPFLMIDCSLFYERELERELFGYRPGPGEPAEAARQGLLEFSPRGSCYAANVEELSPSIQLRILNFLDTGYIQAVGDDRPIPSRMRLIFSSEKNLEGLSKGGLFSEELFLRFTGFTFQFLALRDRKEDIAPLVRHFVDRYFIERGGGSGTGVQANPDALEALQMYPWPGNVDELKEEVGRVLRAGHKAIVPEVLSSPILHHWRGRRGDPAIVRVIEELHERIQEFRVMSRLDAQYGDILLDEADWDVMFKAYER